MYVRTALPGVAYGDWGEMQIVPHVLGVSHPTGYPTYVLLAAVVELLPLGSVAWRGNVLSGVLLATAVALLVAILQRLGVRTAIAVGSALAFGAVGTVWSAATVAEVNPLHVALMCALILLALRWADERRPTDLVLGGLVTGLSLGNHLLTLFVAPFLLAYALWAGWAELRRRPGLVAGAELAGVLGLAVYAYIPLAALRDPPLAYNHPTTLDGFLWLVTGEQFRYQFDLLSVAGPADLLAHLPELAGVVLQRATPVLPILGLLGLPLLVRRRRAFGLVLVAALLTGIYVWATYQRLEHYLLVPLVILCIGMAAFLEALAGRFRRLPAIGAAAALGFALVLAGLNWSDSDRSGEHGGENYVATLFGVLPTDAAVISYWDPTMPLWYGQFVDGLRPDVLVLDDSNIAYDGWRGDTLAAIADQVCRRPTFVMRINEDDLGPIRQRYRLDLFLTIRSSALGPTAILDQPVYRVERPESGCPQ